MNVRYGSTEGGGRQTPNPMTFPEKDERPKPVLYNHKGEPLYLVKPKFGYRRDDE